MICLFLAIPAHSWEPVPVITRREACERLAPRLRLRDKCVQIPKNGEDDLWTFAHEHPAGMPGLSRFAQRTIRGLSEDMV